VQVFAQAFWMPKAGNTDAEYEDAFWHDKPVHGQAACARFAVADGATETSFSKIWAAQLVRNYCKGRFDISFPDDTLRTLQQRWETIVRRRPLPWYAEEKVRSGAFAAILGLVLRDQISRNDSYGQWQAMALGDSCLVQMRRDEILARFPLDNSEAFTNRPHLLSSNPAYNNLLVEHLRTMEGTWVQGDTFYLMTDALACWFMSEAEKGQVPWSVLRDLDTNEEVKPFRDWVTHMRTERAIRNDDVTLLRIDLA
jgi:hypothetical protein